MRLEAEARELSKELAQLDEGVKAMNAEPTEAKAKSPGKSPGKEPVKAPDAKGLRDRADGIDDDLAFMQRRLKDMKLGEEDLRRVERSRETVKEVRRALSRNQNPRPSNRLADASGDVQVIGDELMRRIEEVLRKRKITEPADETAPEEYRRLVEKYYRALSED